MLKMILLVVTSPARRYNPVIAAFYERLRGRGESTKAAGMREAEKVEAPDSLRLQLESLTTRSAGAERDPVRQDL